MSVFALNLVLAIVWVALTGEASLPNFFGGFIMAYFILALVQRTFDPSVPAERYVTKVWLIILFAGYFMETVIIANLRMAWAVLSPNSKLKPAVVAIPLDITHPAAITLLANWITLTPGTLTLDITEDRRTIVVHTYDRGSSVAAFRQQIKQDFERRVKELFE